MIDNRSPKNRLLDDIIDLARMAHINEELIDKALDETRAFAEEGETLKLMFQRSGLDNLRFVASDLFERAHSIRERLNLLQDEDEQDGDQEEAA